MTWFERACLAAALLAIVPACGGDDETRSPDDTIDMLNPSVEHYGKKYAEWAGEWVKYLNRVAPPECVNPAVDETGASCASYQDETSDVFMLSGNYGGVTVRDACVVPADKAIFLPLVNVYGDNAGVPESMLISDAEIRTYVDENFALMDVESLRLSVDGHAIDRLERGAVESAPYTLELVAGENVYACQMVDAEGEFPGYVAGYWALLAPLAPGEHSIEFEALKRGSPGTLDVDIDVTYELTVE